MVRNGCNYNVFVMEQVRADHEAALIMKQVMPALLRNELGNDDSHLLVGLICLALHHVDKFTERLAKNIKNWTLVNSAKSF